MRIGEIPPPCLFHHKPHENPLNQQPDLKEGRGICREGGRGEDKVGGKGILTKTPSTIKYQLNLRKKVIT